MAILISKTVLQTFISLILLIYLLIYRILVNHCLSQHMIVLHLHGATVQDEMVKHNSIQSILIFIMK